MRQKILGLAMAVGLLQAGAASAALIFDSNVTPDVIFGSGNTNGSFTVNQANSIELGLRGKLRHNAVGLPENTFNSNGDGTYSFDAGVAPTKMSPTAVWSFEWSINSNVDGGGGSLDGLFYELGIDLDPGVGTNYNAFDPINLAFADHAIGDNSTGNGGGTSAGGPGDYANLIANNNVAQNSWKPHWFNPGFDPTVDGTYNFYLLARGDTGIQLARTDIQIIVGAGAVPVPVPATFLLLFCGLISMGAVVFGRRAGTAV